MACLNKFQLIGHLGADPETRFFTDGSQVTNTRVATTEKWKDKTSGEVKESTEWHRLVFKGRMAETAAQYLKKGSQIYAEGKIRTRKWTKENVDHYVTEVHVDHWQILDRREGGAQQPANRQPPKSAPTPQPASNTGGGGSDEGGGFGGDGFEDDIPFASSAFGADPMLKKHPF